MADVRIQWHVTSNFSYHYAFSLRRALVFESVTTDDFSISHKRIVQLNISVFIALLLRSNPVIFKTQPADLLLSL